jgi:hypothetical protein
MKLKAQTRWYVYELVDPRTGETFYVGKGTGKRIEAHEAEAKAGQVCSKKVFHIKEIWASGKEVERRFNAMFWDEQAAYDHETDLIATIGLDNLTNVLPGGMKAWAERQEELELRRLEKVNERYEEFVFKRIGSHLIPHIASWLKLGGHKGAVFNLKSYPKDFYLNAKITEVVYNSIIPDIVQRILKKEDLRLKLADALKPHGVELSYGCA